MFMRHKHAKSLNFLKFSHFLDCLVFFLHAFDREVFVIFQGLSFEDLGEGAFTNFGDEPVLIHSLIIYYETRVE